MMPFQPDPSGLRSDLGKMSIRQPGPRLRVSPSTLGLDKRSADWPDTPEGARRTTLEDQDPAYAAPLNAYIIDVLYRASAVGMGPYWEKADPLTKRSLEKFLS